jgi:hypothetical protein
MKKESFKMVATMQKSVISSILRSETIKQSKNTDAINKLKTNLEEALEEEDPIRRRVII